MNTKDKWRPVVCQTLAEGEARAVVTLRDSCNAVDGLDLKLALPMSASEDTENSENSDGLQWSRALLIYAPATAASAASAAANGDLIGYCSIDGGWHSVELCGMVAPEWRRQGIGGALLASAFDVCKANAIEKVLLLAEEASAAGKAFALAHGGMLEFAEHRMELQDFAAMHSGLAREPHLTLRLASRDETGTLARIQSTVFSEQAEVVAIQASIEQEFANREARFYLAALESIPVSSLKLYVQDGRASIYAFGVLPEYRRRGLAWQTLALLAEHLQTEGITQIGLEVETANSPAVALYQACGFRPVTTYGYYQLELGK